MSHPSFRSTLVSVASGLAAAIAVSWVCGPAPARAAAGYGAACLPGVAFTNILGMRWDTRAAHVARHAEMFRGAFAGSRLTTGQVGKRRPTRGYRRIDWLISAVAPVKERLGPARFARLVSALASCVGMDAQFVLQDVRGLSPRAAERVTRWTARTLLDASVTEAGACHP